MRELIMLAVELRPSLHLTSSIPVALRRISSHFEPQIRKTFYSSFRFYSMASLTASAKSAEVPWHAAYPAVKTASIPTITCKELLHWYEEGKKPGLDFVLVDLRRADHEVCFPFLPWVFCFSFIFSSILMPKSRLDFQVRKLISFHFYMKL
jgi:hypothetical protein